MYHSLSCVKIDTKEKVFPLLELATKQYDINSRTCWNILKNKTLGKNSLKIKKAVAWKTTALGMINMDNTKAKKQLEKYLKVLKNVKQSHKGKDSYWATCPNPKGAHNFTNKTTGAYEETQNFQIQIQETQGNKHITTEEARAKFGDYMVSYYCHAHGEKGKGPCSNTNLAKHFKDKYGIGERRSMHEDMEPSYFPEGDDSYLEVNKIGERNHGLFFYTGPIGEKLFLRWRSKEGKYFPICFSHHAGNGKDEFPAKKHGGWVERMLWDGNYTPYLFHTFFETPRKKVCNLFEGEGTALKGCELFPDDINTTLYCSKTSWTKSNLEYFKGFDLVNVFPDFDKGKIAFKQLTLALIDLGINAKLVNLPTDIGLPLGWDIKDKFPEGVSIADVKEWIANAETPKPREENDFSNLEEDANAGRYVHLESDKKYHYDTWKKKITHNDNLNLWYCKDTETRDLQGRRIQTPVKYLHQIGCEVVEGIAYMPIDKEYIWEGKKKYVNSYTPFVPIELDDEQIKNINNEPFFHSARIHSNFDDEVYKFFLDVVAFTVQHPEQNMKFATLIVSGSEGTGKTSLWKCIEGLHGGIDYCVWLRDVDLFHKFRPWMKDKSIVFCNEVSLSGTKSAIDSQINSLKDLIMENTHMIEPKGVNPYQIKNQFTLFMSSNFEALQLIQSRKMRRYFVMNCHMEREEIEEKYPTHFDEFIKFSEDPVSIAGLYYYFKHEHKISKDFKPWKPLETSAKDNMARANQSQLWNNLDELLFERKAPFKFDIVNKREIYEYLKDEDWRNNTNFWKDADERELQAYLSMKGKILNNGNDLKNMRGGGSKERSRGWWTIRHKKHWLECKPHQLRLHLEGKYHAPDFRNKQEEMFDDTKVSNEGMSIHGDHNDKQQGQG